MSETEQKWQAFRRRHRELFRRIIREEDGFWEGVADLWECHLQETRTTRGVVVREFPETREVGTQTVEKKDEAEAREFPETRETETQMTPEMWMLLAELQAERRGRGEATGPRERKSPRENRAESTAKNPSKEEPRAGSSGTQKRNASPRVETRRTGPIRKGCWNCRDSQHKYAECVRPRREFCFRCGKSGTTIRDCPSCREEWYAQGPYVPGKGHKTRGRTQ